MKLKDYLEITPDSYLNIKITDVSGNTWKAESHHWHCLNLPDKVLESEITIMVPYHNEISVLLDKNKPTTHRKEDLYAV